MRYYVFLKNFLITSIATFTTGTLVLAAEPADNTTSSEDMRKCMEASVIRADEAMTVKELKAACKLLLSQSKTSLSSKTDIIATEPPPKETADKPPEAIQPDTPVKPETPDVESIDVKPKKPKKVIAAEQTRLLKDRLTIEALNRSNRFILTPHKRNYLMPASYSANPNTAPYLATISDAGKEADPSLTDLNHTETELQLSVKILLRENIFDKNGHLYLGYTNHAFWQVYNRKISAPFRESDHQPELILSFTNDLEIFGFRNVLNEVALNHQSNGQTGLLSRSWNRVMLNSVFERDNFAFAFNPWYRLPEPEPEYAGDPKGDDNPDISHYMGHFELTGAYKYKSDIFSLQVRNNLESDNRGAIELGWTFPVTATMRGYVNYFDGYGHSLIDYNVKQQVVGLGIIFTDLF